jgi:hypothetical protein
MAYTTIDDPSAYFHTQLYTGNGSTQSITNNANAGDFQPDWVWIKNRGQSDQQHNLYDSTRGSTKRLESSNNGAESTKSNGLTSFDSDGFSVGSADQCNENSENLVAWQWKANGGTTTTNDASATGVGDIDSVYQANTTAGFSIVTYTHTGNDDRVAHGLGATPKVVIIKERGGAGSWYYVTTQVDGSLEYLLLESQNAIASLGYSVHTSTTFPSLQFDNTDTAVAYCFTEIQGYSKFGSYTGNGDADGPFIYTGFKPAWFLVKSTSQSNQQWYVFDNKRDTINPVTRQLQPNLTDAENNVTNSPLDFLSNGIKIRNTSGHDNTNNGGYIYMAFAEHPFVSSEGVPVTAR